MEKISRIVNLINGNSFINDAVEVAIMIPLINIDGKPHLIFQKRSKFVNQPGDVSFPGGHKEAFETYKEAAIRETKEEFCLKDENINYIGKLGRFFNYFHLYAEIFVCEIVNIDYSSITPLKEEVEEIFTLSLEELVDITPRLYTSKIKVEAVEDFPYNLIEGGKNYGFRKGSSDTYFYIIRNRVIWGITAYVLKSFLEVIQYENS